ncbi:MAG: hypothetical protein GX117_04975, partial [Candidatus Hydrogenedentes bacterium]|nr:hypothetical protein [Candidatus Hydrogenedentota bacterium]
VLTLDSGATPHETEALERFLSGFEAELQISDDRHTLTIRCPNENPDAMRQALEPLVTVLADECYPHFAPLRERLESLTLYLNSDGLDDDILFVDTPGVHSISDTRQKITYDIIENCHLVVLFVDSGFVGNIHDLNFIKRVITCRNRRVFFVLNKADRLDPDEIDPRALQGPAAQLLETFRRNDIPDNADVFFLSGYRALRAIELDQGRLSTEEAFDDNKLLLPTAVAESIENSEAPARDLAAFLMGQSRFSPMKERLYDYLVNESKSNAVVYQASRFVAERSADYLISIRNTLRLARDPRKFEELRASRDALMERLASIRNVVEAALADYTIRFRGGEKNGEKVAGYVEKLRALLTAQAMDKEVVQPVLTWLRKDNHLKQARREKFKPLAKQLEHQVDIFVSDVLATMKEIVDASEKEMSDCVAEQIEAARDLRSQLTEPEKMLHAQVESSVSGEYVAFGTGGAVVGAMTGAAVGSIAPGIGTAIGAGIGGLLGAALGFLARLAWSEDRWISKLTPLIEQNANQMILKSAADNDKSIALLIEEYLENRGTTFEKAVKDELENALTSVQSEYDALLEREAEIRSEREKIISRLEPKEVRLEGIRARAETVVEEDTLPWPSET